jgi:hypothetical protein
MSLWSRFLDVYGSLWARLEAALARFRHRARHQRRQIETNARALRAGAIQLGMEVWDRVDDLPFVPAIFKMPPLRNQYYGHGAFMGAAPALLADPAWRRILAFLLPDVYQDISAAIERHAPPSDLIPMFENNPVMCAFGVWRAIRSRRSLDLFEPGQYDLSGLEWDVFLDGELVHKWEISASFARPPILKRLVDTMLIAHASSTDTVQEAIGLCQYKDVRKTRKTAMGGVQAGHWLDFFARALLLSQAPDVGSAIREMSAEARVESDEECMTWAFARPMGGRQAIAVYKQVTGKDRFSAVLEIKSLRSTVELMHEIIAELNSRGVHVAAVGSFLLGEIRGLSDGEQSVEGRTWPGPREVQFFHYAGDLQHACDVGQILRGQSVLFNGASLLLAHDTDGDFLLEYVVKDEVVAEIDDYRRRFDLHIGVYVQEGDCDNDAAALLSELVMRESTTFELGFAWGGLLDEVGVAREKKLPHLGYGSQKKLERVGKARQWKLAVVNAVEATPGSAETAPDGSMDQPAVHDTNNSLAAPPR